MKVNIGPYINWTGPYQIASAIIFWADEYNENDKWADRAYRLGSWLANDKHGNDSGLMKLCNWIQSKRTRKISVRIDKWDTWGMDSTLALIVLPMLQQLRATKHGAPLVDDGDVPDELKSTSAPAKESEYDTDGNHFRRWDWVLDEMIWAFTQKVDDDAESQFYDHGTPVPGEHIMDAVKRVKIDFTGMQGWQARKNNGFRLFGKYYENLWD